MAKGGDSIWGTVCHRTKERVMMTDLPSLLFKKLLELFSHWDWKKGFFLAIAFIALLSYHRYLNNEKLNDESNKNQQLLLENGNLKTENNDLRSKLGELGTNTEQYTGSQKSVTDFKRDWDTSDFYVKENDIFCPKKKGGNNYQRMFYKHDTPLTASDLILKFRIVDQDDQVSNYTQRVVTGQKFNDGIFSEFDIPTRDSNNVNFRIGSESGGLISGGRGKSISSTIKDKSIIYLHFRTQFKSNQEVTQFIDLDYFSSISDYGQETKTISYDAQVSDPQPKTAKSNIFIGSYFGGCVKIIEWKAN